MENKENRFIIKQHQTIKKSVYVTDIDNKYFVIDTKFNNIVNMDYLIGRLKFELVAVEEEDYYNFITNLDLESETDRLEVLKIAKEWLTDLKNCTNCTNCIECENCTNCEGCGNCTNCSDCTDCFDCENCTNCSGCSECSNINNEEDMEMFCNSTDELKKLTKEDIEILNDIVQSNEEYYKDLKYTYLSKIDSLLQVIDEKEVLGLVIASNAGRNFISFDFLFLCYLNGIYDNSYELNKFKNSGSDRQFYEPIYELMGIFISKKYKDTLSKSKTK